VETAPKVFGEGQLEKLCEAPVRLPPPIDSCRDYAGRLLSGSSDLR